MPRIASRATPGVVGQDVIANSHPGGAPGTRQGRRRAEPLPIMNNEERDRLATRAQEISRLLEQPGASREELLKELDQIEYEIGVDWLERRQAELANASRE